MNLTALCVAGAASLRRDMPGILSTKTCKVMKLTAFFLLVTCLQVSASGFGQKITLSGKDMPLTQVFSKIKKQSGYLFFYSDKDIKNTRKVTIDVRSEDLIPVLNQVFSDQPLSYSIIGKTIVVRMKGTESSVSLLLQGIEVKGRVVNESGQPVAGATVTVKGTNQGTATNANGEFSLSNVDENATLVITGVSIETVEVKVNGRASISIAAKTKVSSIDAVQIIAYGTTTKRLSTSTISSIKGEEIGDRPVSNIFQALQGKLSGLTIANTSAGIGAPAQLLVRGMNSITSGNNPLIIVDGVIVNEMPGGLITAEYKAGANGRGSNTYVKGISPLNFLNPDDIESVDILKDADATAIYGSRGTNGVILITTRKPSLGKTKVAVNMSTGWKKDVGVTKRLNTQQYLQLRKDAFATGNMTATSVINPITPTNFNAPDLLLWSQTAYTDYPKFELQNPAPDYNADISLSSGTKALNFIASGSYYKMYDTYMFNPYQERMTGRMNVNHTSANDKLNLSLGAIFGVENQTFTTTSLNSAEVGGVANINAPNFELYKSDGTLNYGVGQGYITGSYYNPLPNKNISSKSKTNNLLLNSELSYSFIKDLTVKLQVSYNSQANVYHQLYPSTAVNPQNTSFLFLNPRGLHTTNKFTSLNLEPQLTYTKKVSKAILSALVGATFLEKKDERTAVIVNNPGSDDLLFSYSSGNPTDVSSDNNIEKFTSVFGRINVDWDRKYVANFNFRRDGSSRFGPNNRFADFGSAGLAWIFTSEEFFKNNVSWLSFGKLRGSLGTTGNNNIADYQYMSLLQAPTSSIVGSYNGMPGLDPTTFPNPDVEWETTTKRDVGIELGFLNNRINLTATWYRSTSSNLLVSIPLATQTGYQSYVGNFPGKVQNTGLELDITSQNLSAQSKLKWTTKLNISHNKNILAKFDNIEQTVYAQIYKVGRALPSFDLSYQNIEFPYRFTGINPDNGLPEFKDINKDGQINFYDRYNNDAWGGSSVPTLWGGLTNSFSYKGFTLDVFLQFSNGIFTKWNFNKVNTIGAIFNPSIDVIGNYWMKPGDVKKYPRLYTGVPGIAAYINPIRTMYPFSDAALYKGYYIRLKNVQLTYTLPEKWISKIKFTNASVYISGENLAVYTPVKLYKDPEVFWSQGAGILRTITTGIRLEF